MTDTEDLRAMLRDEFARLNDRLNVLESKLALIPCLNFLHQSELAQRCLEAIRKAETRPPPPHEGLMVTPDLPGRSPGPDRVR
jgi:hypothetical protein